MTTLSWDLEIYKYCFTKKNMVPSLNPYLLIGHFQSNSKIFHAVVNLFAKLIY